MRSKPVLAYGDPSHDPNNTKKRPKVKSDSLENKPSIKTKKRRSIGVNISDKEEYIALFSDSQMLQEATLSYLQTQEQKGDFVSEINRHVVAYILGDTLNVDGVLNFKEVRDLLSKARRSLGKEGKIGYNREQQIWYVKKFKKRQLTEKEQRFLQLKGLGEGWVNIPTKIEAVKWLHREFTDDEFEQFCCGMLAHCNVQNVKVTPKRRYSGADGGLDGLGDFKIESEIVKVAFEAKKHALNAQVGSDICQKLVGAMMEHKIKHGFIITTAVFSERAKKSVQNFKENEGYQIELIDQDRMAEIMIFKQDSPHGFGLHRTDKGLIYMNEDILRQAVKSC